MVRHEHKRKEDPPGHDVGLSHREEMERSDQQGPKAFLPRIWRQEAQHRQTRCLEPADAEEKKET